MHVRLNLVGIDRPKWYLAIGIKFVAASLMALTVSAFAAPDPLLCKMAGSLARGIAENRDRGMSYNNQLAQINGANEDVNDRAGIMRLAIAELKLIYLDMPKITPEGAYQLYYMACMSAK